MNQKNLVFRVQSTLVTAAVLAAASVVGVPVSEAATTASSSSTTGTASSGSNSTEVSASTATSFAFSFRQSALVGQSVPITLTVEDANGALVPNYTGTVHLSSSDGNAAVPSDYTFQPSDHGKHTFWITFNATGSQTVSFTGTNDSRVSGEVRITVNPTTLMLAHPIHLTVNQQDWIDPIAFALDSSSRVPIYHVQYVLNRLGISSTWDGSRLSLSTPSWLPISKPQTVIGSGSASIYLNGSLVAHFTPVVETKWDGPPPTTYADFLNVFQSLSLLGISSSWTQGDKEWNWQVPLIVEGKQVVFTGEKDPLTVTWTNGSVTEAIPTGAIKWMVSGPAPATIESTGQFRATVPGLYLATGYYEGLPVSMKIKVEPTVDHWLITANTLTITADGNSIDLITVTALDAHGKPVPNADLAMSLDTTGLATLDHSTSTTSQSGQAQFNLEAGKSAGTVTITVTGGESSASTKVKLVLLQPQPQPRVLIPPLPSLTWSDMPPIG